MGQAEPNMKHFDFFMCAGIDLRISRKYHVFFSNRVIVLLFYNNIVLYM